MVVLGPVCTGCLVTCGSYLVSCGTHPLGVGLTLGYAQASLGALLAKMPVDAALALLSPVVQGTYIHVCD